MTEDFLQSPEFQAMTKEYLEYLAALLPEIVEKFEASDNEAVYKYAHNIKGTGTSYGFENLSQLGADICDEMKEQKYEDISEKLSSIGSILKEELAAR